MTLIEMVVSMALLAVFFAVLLPQFRILHRSWGLREASAESLQNGRVLLDHMQSKLAAARRITAVSDASQPLGFLEYLGGDGERMRYAVQDDGWVVFGPVGSPALLAGPVSRLSIEGFAADDLDRPASDPAAMRLLRVTATFAGSENTGRDRTFSSSIFLRTEAMP